MSWLARNVPTGYDSHYWLWLSLLVMIVITGYDFHYWLWLSLLAMIFVTGYDFHYWLWMVWLAFNVLTGHVMARGYTRYGFIRNRVKSQLVSFLNFLSFSTSSCFLILPQMSTIVSYVFSKIRKKKKLGKNRTFFTKRGCFLINIWWSNLFPIYFLIIFSIFWHKFFS